MGCLNSAQAIAPSDPRVHEREMEFLHDVRPVLASLPPKVAEVLKSELSSLGASTDLNKTNEAYLSQHKESPSHVLAAVRVQRMLGGDQVKCEKHLLAIPAMKGTTLEEACEALDTLKSWRSGEAEAFKKTAGKRWPEASRFC